MIKSAWGERNRSRVGMSPVGGSQLRPYWLQPDLNWSLAELFVLQIEVDELAVRCELGFQLEVFVAKDHVVFGSGLPKGPGAWMRLLACVAQLPPYAHPSPEPTKRFAARRASWSQDNKDRLLPLK